jgi:ech hydrogenase subunit D
MAQEQSTFEPITVASLQDRVRELRKQGFRLVQIGATRLPEQVELTYSFDLEQRLVNLRLFLPADQANVPSISSIYWCAFLYENEIHDLFNVQVDGMAVDFHGTLYTTAVKYPFGSVKAPPAKTAPTAAPKAVITSQPAA